MTEIYNDEIPDAKESERTVIEAGIYQGHIFGVEAHESNPSKKPGKNFGKTWPMHRFYLRLNADAEGKELSKPVRLSEDLFDEFGTPSAPTIKRAFMLDNDVIAKLIEDETQAEMWRNPNLVGRPCTVEVKHRLYKKATGEMERDEKGYVIFDPTTQETVAKMEDAVALEVKKFYPHLQGRVMDLGEVQDKETVERNEVQDVDGENASDDEGVPF